MSRTRESTLTNRRLRYSSMFEPWMYTASSALYRTLVLFYSVFPHPGRRDRDYRKRRLTKETPGISLAAVSSVGFAGGSEVCHMPTQGPGFAKLLPWVAAGCKETQSVLTQLICDGKAQPWQDLRGKAAPEQRLQHKHLGILPPDARREGCPVPSDFSRQCQHIRSLLCMHVIAAIPALCWHTNFISRNKGLCQ